MIENNVHCVLDLITTSRHGLSIRPLSAFEVIADYQSPWHKPMDHDRDGVCQWHYVVLLFCNVSHSVRHENIDLNLNIWYFDFVQLYFKVK